MPARRRYPKRSRRMSRKSTLSRRAYSLAKKAYASTDQELKYVDAIFEDTPVVSYQSATAIQAFQMNQIGRGTSANERIGQQAKMISSYLQLSLEKAGGNANPTSEVRLALVYDREPNQVLPRAPQLWQDSGSTNVQTGLNQPIFMNNKFRWRVLWDIRLTLSDAYKQHLFIKKYKRLRSLPVRFTGTTGNAGQTSTGALWLFAISDITEGGAVPLLSGTHRLKFIG